MKKIYNILLLGSLLSAGSLFTSCDDQLEQINPNKATEGTFWQNEEDFEMALTSCYTPLKNALNGGYYGTRGVMMRIARADEVEFRNDISDVYQASFFTNTSPGKPQYKATSKQNPGFIEKFFINHLSLTSYRF